MADVATKVLVADDREHNRLIYRDCLREIRDLEIVEANGGQRALELAREHDFAMFLLDINMPDMDGFELASRLREEPRAEATPIVFVTSETTDKPYLMRGYRMGAVDFMVSAPVHGEILVQKARVFLQIFRKRQELQGIVHRVRHENTQLHTRLEEFVREQEALRAQAAHDELTQLPNRALFLDRLAAASARARRARQRFALAYVDLEGLKAVNDRHGKATGDALIVSIAQRLSKTLRATDTVARVGSDKFALLFENLGSRADAARVAQKAYHAITEAARLRSESDRVDVQIRTGASIGVAIHPDHATEDDDLLVLAELTQYAVKQAGGGISIYPGNDAGARLADNGVGAGLRLVRENG